MFDLIHGNLIRQFKGLELLGSLLEEEFELLRQRDTDSIATLEFSIHELLRQIAQERMNLKDTLQTTTLKDFAGILPEEQGVEVLRLYHLIDALEQSCSRQATYPTELSLALLDQSQSLLVQLHRQISPRLPNRYGAEGRMVTDRPSAAIYSGRL
jgi:hypothetical protein